MGEETRLGNTILRRENERLIEENQRFRQLITQRENELRALAEAREDDEIVHEKEADELMRNLDDTCNQLLRILDIPKNENRIITDQLQGCINTIEIRMNRESEDNRDRRRFEERIHQELLDELNTADTGDDIKDQIALNIQRLTDINLELNNTNGNLETENQRLTRELENTEENLWNPFAEEPDDENMIEFEEYIPGEGEAAADVAEMLNRQHREEIEMIHWRYTNEIERLHDYMQKYEERLENWEQESINMTQNLLTDTNTEQEIINQYNLEATIRELLNIGNIFD
jgi:hypothetical protein